jgi:hypothetical protein
MFRQKVTRVVTTMMLVLVGSGPLQASAQDAPGLGVSIGYQALRLAEPPCTTCSWNWYQLGVTLDAAVPVTGAWVAVGDFGWARHPFTEDPARHAGGLNALTVGGGFRWHRWSDAALAPFAQVIAGLHRDSADGGVGPGILTFVRSDLPVNSFMLQPGVGVLYPMSARWGIVGQLDYRRVFADAARNGIRVVAGVRINRR